MNRRTLKYAFRITHIQNVPHVLRCGLVRAGSPQSDPSYVSIGDRQVIRLREALSQNESFSIIF